MKIGLTTLHDYNFGSALQCYASQCYFDSLGIDCEVIDFSGSMIPFAGQMKKIRSLSGMCLRNISSLSSILKTFNSQRAKGMTLSEKSMQEIHRFNFTHINRKCFSYRKLQEKAKTEEYSFFLSGSDQVWNGSRIDSYDKFFLRFAPKEKRVAWMASFGGNSIASYNQNRYKKYISDYHYISVRENSGARLVKELTGREADVLVDPVFLLNAEQWREKFASVDAVPGKKYIAAFFIDKPSNKAQDFLKLVKEDTDFPIYSFGYNHEMIKADKHIDGGPMEFLRFLDSAEYVITDSFHAIAFSVIFKKNFYVFERMYTHNQKQSERITGLLDSICLTERYEPDSFVPSIPCYISAESYLTAKKNDVEAFVSKVTGSYSPVRSAHMVWNEKRKCCGCGVCVDACPANALELRPDESGVFYPCVDNTKCINCGKCQRVCSFKKCEQSIQHAYIGTANDKNLISYSASGGAFAVLAKYILNKGGVVFGASLWFDDGKIRCEHIAIDNLSDLWKIQGSKYVQSKTQGIFSKVKQELSSGRIVLFGGTSCQVAALKSFLGKEYDNLYTTDLVCHGVPPLKTLEDYIEYQSKKIGEPVETFRFRTREGENRPYLTTTTTKGSNGELHRWYVTLRNSAYYRLFMSNSGYRISCYNCPFACSHKPADITLADQYLKDNAELLSCVLVNNEKGKNLLDAVSSEICLTEIDISVAVGSHEQLLHASIPTRTGEKMLCKYKEYGFEQLQKEIDLCNIMTSPIALIKRFRGHCK
jgi:coenzyme F420-reducing hydrogenase beta subunit